MDIDKIRKEFDDYSQEYDGQRKSFIPFFDVFYEKSVSLVKYYKNDFSNIVDLGAGTGLFTAKIYELYRDAHYTLIDISNDMLKVARERFRGLDNFEFIESNYVNDLPVGRCDLICSALSIHHLEDSDKKFLYRNIYEKLDQGGCFVNLDQFCGTSKMMNDLYNRWWYDYIDNNGIDAEGKNMWTERRKLDRENTIPATIELLKNSGFREAECIYNFMKFGAILSIK